MEQIMAYVDKNDKYNQYVLLNITHNIIESLPEFNDLRYNIEFGNFEIPYNLVYYYNGEIMIGINPYMDEGNDSIQNIMTSIGFDDYLLYNNISDTKIATFIFCILHELGHIIMHRYIPDKFDYRVLTSINESYTNAMYNILSRSCLTDEHDDYNFDISYAFNPIELHAHLFAYKYFMYVWNILKQRGLI